MNFITVSLRLKAFHFPGKFNFLVKTITDFSQTWSSLLKFRAQYRERGYMFCEIYLQSAAHITKIHDLFIYFIFKFF